MNREKHLFQYYSKCLVVFDTHPGPLPCPFPNTAIYPGPLI